MTDSGSDTPVSRRTAIKVLGGVGTTGLAGLAGCSGEEGTDGGGSDGDGGGADGASTDNTGTTSSGESIKAAWLYISEPGDLGWSWAHDQGRKAVDETFDWLETATSADVTPSDAERVLREYTQNDYDVVFGTTFEYMDPMANIAEKNPDVIYEHCSGYETRENMGRYFGRMYQARYLAGMAAGTMTEEDALGYVAAFPIPEVVRGINAFTLGARSVNDQVTTTVRWTNTWYDPTAEQEAAQSLIDEGVDVMAQHQDSPSAVRTANEAGIWSTGYDAPMGEFGGDGYITSPLWHWEVFYEPTVTAVRDGSWTSDFYYEGLESGIVDIDEWGPEVPQDVKDEVSAARSDIESGDLDVWADSKFADESETFRFQEMASYVEGVEGSVPES
ncbi:BMP family ABC transporter substrate-binding protein [Halobacteriales archaeon QS_4_69_31]|nr:MAG: BMP family ABC transporter substrate-binding protein [Halobacteriales archaeon QS_4_69_31]